MLSITNELKAKLLAAKSEEEAAALVKANGQEITEEESALLWKEITSKRGQDGKEFSLDELEAVSGGQEWGNLVWVRNYATEGCAATVEPGSNCWGTDGNCWLGNVYYILGPVDVKCPDCGVYCYVGGRNNYLVCPKCGKGFYG